jgi:Fe-Mn family superoxide dismutase
MSTSLTIYLFQKPTPEDKPSHEHHISPHLAQNIRHQFSNMEMLKTTVAGTALGMAGSGHVWLVTDAEGRLAVLPTFASGTMLVRARKQTTFIQGSVTSQDRELDEEAAQRAANMPVNPALGYAQRQGQPASKPFNMFGSSSIGNNAAGAAPTSPTSGVVPPRSATGMPEPPSGSRAFSSSSHAQQGDSLFTAKPPSAYADSPSAEQQLADTALSTMKPPPIDNKGSIAQLGQVTPLFCVSVHERNWLAAGYGVWGAEAWMAEFWSVLDWEKVGTRYAAVTREFREKKQQAAGMDVNGRPTSQYRF